jgi:hypothetical protein
MIQQDGSIAILLTPVTMGWTIPLMANNLSSLYLNNIFFNEAAA